MRNPVATLIFGACLAALPACVKPVIAACTAVPFVPFQDVYPIDGATSVPDSPQSIVVAQILNPAISGLQLVLTPPSGPAIVANPGPAPSPLPTPFASPPAGAPLIGFSVPALAAGTTYQITFNGTETVTGGFCPGMYGISNRFSFTTK
jgi:hypothetical protein